MACTYLGPDEATLLFSAIDDSKRWSFQDFINLVCSFVLGSSSSRIDRSVKNHRVGGQVPCAHLKYSQDVFDCGSYFRTMDCVIQPEMGPRTQDPEARRYLKCNKDSLCGPLSRLCWSSSLGILLELCLHKTMHLVMQQYCRRIANSLHWPCRPGAAGSMTAAFLHIAVLHASDSSVVASKEDQPPTVCFPDVVLAALILLIAVHHRRKQVCQVTGHVFLRSAKTDSCAVVAARLRATSLFVQGGRCQ